MNHMKPAETLKALIETSKVKASMPIKRMVIFGIFAGAYIAFAGAGANMAAYGLLSSTETFGLGKILSGTIFTVGLIMVVLGGAELFTGNTTMIAAVIDKRITVSSMLKNWVIVYICNFIGGVLIAFMVYYSGVLNSGEGMLGAMTVKIAAGKVNMSFGSAFASGILCNWLVCMAVWLSTGAQTTVGKILSIFFPIWLFVTAGFEHSVANMYFIPAGIFAKSNQMFTALSDVGYDALANLNWSGMFELNLLPVTLGNIVGGAVCVAIGYYTALADNK
ncbi:MAG: formate/nitrite transporter family protein [Firmicutes bacterium]|nr:formate/nitrite transporter family protein [Bacillota bacterium]